MQMVALLLRAPPSDLISVMYNQHNRTGKAFNILLLSMSSMHITIIRLSHSTNDWRKFVNMTGMPYYFNSRLRILTPDDMMDADIRSILLEVFEHHIDSIEEEYELPPDLEHVLWRVSYDSKSEFNEEHARRHSSLSEDSVSTYPEDDFAIYCASLGLGSRVDFRDALDGCE
jgi:hypothetical protein